MAPSPSVASITSVPSTTGRSWIAYGSPGGPCTPAGPHSPETPSVAEAVTGRGRKGGPRPTIDGPLPPLLMGPLTSTPPWGQPSRSPHNPGTNGLLPQPRLQTPSTPGMAPEFMLQTPLLEHPIRQMMEEAASSLDTPPMPNTPLVESKRPLPGLFKIEPLSAPSLWAVPAELPELSRPEAPKISLFGSGVAQAWLSKPGVELALEATFLQGVDLTSLPPESGLLPLSINVNEDGRRSTQVGRQHQPQWFESHLDPSNTCCISRTAFEILWSEQDELGGSFALQAHGSGTVHVNGIVASHEQLTPLLPDAQVTLSSQNGVPLVTFCVHFRLEDAPAVSVPKTSGFFTARRHGRNVRPSENTWWLACDYTNGISSDEVQSLPSQDALIIVPQIAQGEATFVGRSHQTHIFESLLRGAPQLLQFVSRSHLKLEPCAHGDDDCSNRNLSVTNLSGNVVLIDELTHLSCGGSASLHDGQRISFTTHSHVPFMTFRLVSPATPSGKSQRSKPHVLAAPSEPDLEEAFDSMSETSSSEAVDQADGEQTDRMLLVEEVVQCQEPGAKALELKEDSVQETQTETTGATLLESSSEHSACPNVATSKFGQCDLSSAIAKLGDSPPRPRPQQPKCSCPFLGKFPMPWHKGGA